MENVIQLIRKAESNISLPLKAAAIHEALYQSTISLQNNSFDFFAFRNIYRIAVYLYGRLCEEQANANESYNSTYTVRRIRQAESFIKHVKSKGITMALAKEYSTKEVQSDLQKEETHNSTNKRLELLAKMLDRDIDMMRSLGADSRTQESRQ